MYRVFLAFFERCFFYKKSVKLGTYLKIAAEKLRKDKSNIKFLPHYMLQASFYLASLILTFFELFFGIFLYFRILLPLRRPCFLN